MGLKSYFPSLFKRDVSVDRKSELDYELFTRWCDHDNAHELLKSSVVGSTYYAAARSQRGNIYGLVVITQVDRKTGEFYYKDMSEDMLPYYFDCPLSILKLLSPTDNESALEWRKQCREKAERKKSPTALANLPIGARIRFTYGGEMKELVKHPPAYQFKRPFWYNPACHQYMSAKHIPDNYEIVSMA